jgi:Xaa-Pro aminopeptidase
MDFRRRLAGLQAKMEENGIDLVVYGGSPDFQYLTGARVEWRRGRDLMHPEDNLFVPRKGEPILTLTPESASRSKDIWIGDLRTIEEGKPYTETVRKVVADIGVNRGKVAVDDYASGGTVLELAKACAGSRFRTAEGLMDHLRMIKEKEEVDALRKAAELTDQIMVVIVKRITEGLTQRVLELMIEMMARGSGASDISFPTTAGYLKSGTMPADDPFIYPKDSGLVRGTSIAFDVGFVLDGYCSDWGRSVYFGPAFPEVKSAYEALQLAVVETIDKMDESWTVSDVYPAIEAHLDKAGYGNLLRNRIKTGSVGHQIGVEVHEEPWLKPMQSTHLQNGMVFCVEPKLWRKGEYYLRVEDMVTIRDGKAESLTKFDRSLFQL